MAESSTPTQATARRPSDRNLFLASGVMYDALKFAQEIIKDQAERFHKDCRCQLCESCLQMVDKAIAKAEGRQ